MQSIDTVRNPNPSVKIVGDAILELFRSREGNVVVGISGRGGSGKSTAMEKIADFLRHNGVTVLELSVDSFVLPTKERNRNPDGAEARYSDTYDFNTLIDRVVAQLRESISFSEEVPQIDRKLDQQVPRKVEFQGPGVVIIEGVQLFRRSHADTIDLKIWMDLDFKEGLRRAVSRRNHLGGGKTPEQIEEMYLNRSTPGHDLYVERDDPRGQSDFVIDGSKPFD